MIEGNKIVQFLIDYKYLILGAIIYMLQWVFFLKVNPYNVVAKYPTVVFPGLVVEGLLIFYTVAFSYYLKEDFFNKILPIYFKFIIIIVSFIVGILFFKLSVRYIPNVTFYALSGLAIIGLLALIYNVYIKNMEYAFASFKESAKEATKNNILFKMIFYIPCLFIDFIESIKKQLKLTTSTSLIILAVEIILISLWFVIPYLLREYVYHNANILLRGSAYLNREKTLGVFQDITTQKLHDAKDNSKFPYKYNYALSCWIWINPQPSSTNNAYNKSTTLLNYGNTIKINYNKTKLEFFAATSSDEKEKKINNQYNKIVKIHETTDFKYQKWNNFVLNYSGGNLDIFMNNKLIHSVENITPIYALNKVTSGFPDGINGGIKNILYYDHALSKFKISSIYNISRIE